MNNLKVMKKVLVFVHLTILITSCAPAATISSNTTKNTNNQGANYLYEFTLTKPKEDSTLFFEDDKVSVLFLVNNTSLNFMLTNKTNENMKVLWDEAALVLRGSAEKVMHKGIKYNDKSTSQPPTSVPPSSTLNDLVLPIDNVYYREGYYGTYYSSAGGWEERDLFLSKDNNRQDTKESILNLKGTKFSFYLPIQHKGNLLEYNFEFKIRDIKPYYGNKVIGKKPANTSPSSGINFTVNKPFSKAWDMVIGALAQKNISISNQNADTGEIVTGKYISNSIAIENVDGTLTEAKTQFIVACEKDENTGKCIVPKSVDADLIIRLTDKGSFTQVNIVFGNMNAWWNLDSRNGDPKSLQNVRSSGIFENELISLINKVN